MSFLSAQCSLSSLHFWDVPSFVTAIYSYLPVNTFAIHSDLKEVQMKDVVEVLRAKEEEILRVKKEVEALKIAVRLLAEDDKTEHKSDYRQLLQLP